MEEFRIAAAFYRSDFFVFDVRPECGQAPACIDGRDNNNNSRIDYPTDPGCNSFADPSELPDTQCNDGLDNDGDGLIDLGDPGCGGAADTDEHRGVACDNGVDEDDDGLIDFAEDPGCTNDLDRSEFGGACTDDSRDDADDFGFVSQPLRTELSAILCPDDWDYVQTTVESGIDNASAVTIVFNFDSSVVDLTLEVLETTCWGYGPLCGPVTYTALEISSPTGTNGYTYYTPAGAQQFIVKGVSPSDTGAYTLEFK